MQPFVYSSVTKICNTLLYNGLFIDFFTSYMNRVENENGQRLKEYGNGNKMKGISDGIMNCELYG